MKLPELTKNPDVVGMIKYSLAEDIATGDVTTNSLVSPVTSAKAFIYAKQKCIVSGVEVAKEVFKQVDPEIKCESKNPDGWMVETGETVLSIEGPAGSILTAERTALNFMQRMSGIATLTHKFVEKVTKYGVKILDTRKTTPGLRLFEKYAVLCGGGSNHRTGLFDAVLIKDNHRKLWGQGTHELELDKAVRMAKEKNPGIKIEIEVENEEELKSALEGGPDWVLLDNMSPAQMKRCVEICDSAVRLEASGGITLKNVEEVASTGIDAVSLGCLTHSAPSIDLSLELQFY